MARKKKEHSVKDIIVSKIKAISFITIILIGVMVYIKVAGVIGDLFDKESYMLISIIAILMTLLICGLINWLEYDEIKKAKDLDGKELGYFMSSIFISGVLFLLIPFVFYSVGYMSDELNEDYDTKMEKLEDLRLRNEMGIDLDLSNQSIEVNITGRYVINNTELFKRVDQVVKEECGSAIVLFHTTEKVDGTWRKVWNCYNDASETVYLN